MASSTKLVNLAALTLLLVGVTAACQPRPPRVALTVDVIDAGHDDVPGDGVCASSVAGGCSLQAALEEANTAPNGADIFVPNGTYGMFSATVTGDVRINPGTTAALVELRQTQLTVAAGGALELNGINQHAIDAMSSPFGLRIHVAGEAAISRSIVERVSNAGSGSIVLINSVAIVNDPAEVAVRNQGAGAIAAIDSTILQRSLEGTSVVALQGDVGNATHLLRSVVARPATWFNGSAFYDGGGGTCAGEPPVSHGSVFIEEPCGSVGQVGDASGDAGVYTDEFATIQGATWNLTVNLTASSPLVDAIPLGDPGCDTSAVDLYGNPRGVDGNDDGIGGCDIGAVERQPG